MTGKDDQIRRDEKNYVNGIDRTDIMDRMDTRDRMNETQLTDSIFEMRTIEGSRMDDKDEIRTTDGIRMDDKYDVRVVKDENIDQEYDLDNLDEPTPEQVRENRENLR